MNNTIIFNKKPLKERRVELRKNQTEPEKRLWRRLRVKQLGVKFRRQHGIGNYIVDFYSVESRLVIELDGDSHYHDKAIDYDQKRDAYLKSLGLKVIRFTNEQVMNNLEGVIETLQSHLPQEKGRS